MRLNAVPAVLVGFLLAGGCGGAAADADLALGRPAATSGGGDAALAVDGKADGPAMVTDRARQPWWQVDLGEVCTVSSVILHRGEEPPERLAYFYVLVSAEDMAGRSLEGLLDDPAVWRHLTLGRAPARSETTVGWTGRYVRVQLMAEGMLGFAEVEARGERGARPVCRLLGGPERHAVAGAPIAIAAETPSPGVTAIELLEDGKPIARAAAPYAFTVPALAEGRHILTARAVAADGAVGPASAPLVVVASPAGRKPIVIDSDFGIDKDDTFAIALALASREVDVRLITTAPERLPALARFLTAAGRGDVALGAAKGLDAGDPGELARAVDYAGPIYPDGIQAIVDVVKASPDPVTLVGMQALTNYAEAVARDPSIVRRAALVAAIGYLPESGGAASYLNDPACVADWRAARQALGAKWPVTVTPQPFSAQLGLPPEWGKRVAAGRSPLARAVWDWYNAWGPEGPDFSQLCAASAVCAVIAPQTLEIARRRVLVDESGATAYDPKGPELSVAVRWKDLPAAARLLADRVAADGDPQMTQMLRVGRR